MFLDMPSTAMPNVRGDKGGGDAKFLLIHEFLDEDTESERHNVRFMTTFVTSRSNGNEPSLYLL